MGKSYLHGIVCMILHLIKTTIYGLLLLTKPFSEALRFSTNLHFQEGIECLSRLYGHK